MPNDALRADLGSFLTAHDAELIDFRRDMHAHPELGYHEHRATRRIALRLAAAGLRRLGWEARITELIPPGIMCPAAGQGALGIEIRKGDTQTLALLSFLNDGEARITTTCERTLLQALGGGCQVPIGALGELKGGKLLLDAMVGRPDGTEILRHHAEGRDPEKLGRETAAALIAKGADKILSEIYGKDVTAIQQP